jgi:hypothetical protein
MFTNTGGANQQGVEGSTFWDSGNERVSHYGLLKKRERKAKLKEQPAMNQQESFFFFCPLQDQVLFSHFGRANFYTYDSQLVAHIFFFQLGANRLVLIGNVLLHDLKCMVKLDTSVLHLHKI